MQMEIYEGGKRVPLLQSQGFQEKSQNISFKSRRLEAEIREWLKDTVIDTGEEGYDPVFGWGFLKTDNE